MKPFVCLACGCVLSNMNEDWMAGVDEGRWRTRDVRALFLNAHGGYPDDSNLARLNVEKAHVMHKDVKDDVSVYLVDSMVAAGTEWSLPTRFANADHAKRMLEVTEACCKGCNALPHQKFKVFLQDASKIIMKFETAGQRLVAVLLAQITHLMSQRGRNDNNTVAKHAFQSAAAVAYYTSVAMFCMFLGDETGFANGDFARWHTYCFTELPLHDKRGHTLLEALAFDDGDDDSEYDVPTKVDLQILQEDEQKKFKLPPLFTGSRVYPEFARVARNVRRLYFEHWGAIRGFDCSDSGGGGGWALSRQNVFRLEAKLRRVSLAEFFASNGHDAWGLLLLRFIVLARDARAPGVSDYELGGRLLHELAPVALGAYEALAQARRERVAP